MPDNSDEPDRVAVLLFTKFPVPGRAKTRLIPELGAERAAALHRRLAENAVRELREFRSKFAESAITVCYTGAAKAKFRAWLGDGLDYQPQAGGDLGRRLSQAFAAAFAQDPGRVLAIGADVPGLSADIIAAANQALTEHGAVLGPAADG